MLPHPELPAPRWWAMAGTTQAGRQLPHLLPTHLRLDGRSVPELLAYLARFSDYVPFYTAPDQPPTSHWSLATHRHTLLLAIIAAQPASPPDPAPPRRRAELTQLLRQIREAAGDLHNWHYRYVQHEQQYLRPHQHGFVQQLAAELLPLRDLLAEAASYEAALHAAHVLHGLRLLPPDFVADFEDDQQFLAPPASVPTLPADDDWHGVLVADDLKQALLDIWRHFQNARSAVAQLAERTLLHELQIHANHEPEVGLLVAFSQLYRYVQQLINHIPTRQLHYYYQQQLGFGYQPATPDQVYLTFVPTAAAFAVGQPLPVVPAGTLLSAGQDDEGRDILFATQDKAPLSSWQVATLQTLFVASEPDRPGSRVRGIYTGALTEDQPGVGIGPVVAPGWPFMGADPLRFPAFAPVMSPAQVGFAVAAPVLATGPGYRRVTLTVEVTPASFQEFKKILALPPGPQLDELLAAMFEVQATGPAGWLTLAPTAVQVQLTPDLVMPPAPPPAVIWTLTLDRTQPALVGHSPALHGDSLATTHPVLRLLLRPETEARPYGYASFAALWPQRLGVHLLAEPLADLALSNQQGALSPQSPFYPFGAPALPGSYLELALPELLHKDLTELTLKLTWQNLPPQGFTRYYWQYTNLFPLPAETVDPARQPAPTTQSAAGTGEMYGLSIRQQSFEVVVAYAQHHAWHYTDAQPLFPADTCVLPPPSNQLPYTRFQLLKPGRLEPGPDGTGLVQIQLTKPEFGFGDLLYPNALSRVVYANAQHELDIIRHQTNSNQTSARWSLPFARPAQQKPAAELWPPVSWPLPLPNPPLAPQLRSLTVSYQAEQWLDFGPPAELDTGLTFYHLRPFNTHEPARKLAAGPLLPQLTDQGTLYVGLSPDAAGQFIDLVFDLLVPPGTDAPLPVLEWAYLRADDQWQPVQLDPSVRGVMPGFVNAYRVVLELPAGLPTRHSQLPSGLHWLRATVLNHTLAYGQLRAVYPRLTLAQRLDEPELAPYQQPLPPGTLAALLTPLPTVQAVEQPLPSFGGRPAEDPAGSQVAYYTRVSEELRHRGRAVSAWDYERLLLAGFPDVYCTKTVTASQLQQPGHLLVAVLPQASLGPGTGLPLFGEGQLAAMQAFLVQRVSAMVQLRVQNPRYEAVQISCRLSFRSGPVTFGYEQQLQQELVAFLSPWHPKAHEGSHQGFGRFGPATVQQFIQRRPYVQYLDSLSITCQEKIWQVLPAPDPELPPVFGSPEPWVVLVSAPRHDISGISPDQQAGAPPPADPPPGPAAPVAAPDAPPPTSAAPVGTALPAAGIGSARVGQNFTIG